MSVTALGGFAGTVGFTVSGLPAGGDGRRSARPPWRAAGPRTMTLTSTSATGGGHLSADRSPPPAAASTTRPMSASPGDGAVRGRLGERFHGRAPRDRCNWLPKGPRDWAHWGLTTATDFNHKAAVTAADQQLHPGRRRRPRVPRNNNPVGFTWIGGDAPTRCVDQQHDRRLH